MYNWQKHILLTLLIMGFCQYLSAQLCNLPILSNFTNTSQEGFQANWIDFNGAVEFYEIEFGEKGFTRTFDANISNIENNNFSFSGLLPGTAYEIYIRTVCSESNVSDWNGPYFNNTIINNNDACDLSLSITDNNCPISNNYLIEVSDFDNKILGTDINLENVALSITHTWPPDLLIQLTSPNGKSAILSSHNGNGIDNYGDPHSNCMSNANFNDKACIKISDWPPPLSGSFQAEEELSSAFNGEPANGVWQLSICDRAENDVGTLNYFNLEFSEETCQPPQDFIIYDVEGNNVTFNWTHFDNCNTIKLTYNEVGAAPEDVFIDFVDCNDEAFIATGLNPNSTYELMVTTECQSGLSSEPFCELMFETRCQNNSIFESFDEESICEENCDSLCILNGNWKNLNNSSNNWFTAQGPGNSEFTGPKGDKNNTGQYIHVESSLNCSNFESAIITSECLSIENLNSCFISFYYHMFGDEVGSLFLEISADEKNWKVIWEESGDQGDEWYFESIPLIENIKKGKLRFRAETLPNSIRGDIALDHIKLYNATSSIANEYFVDSDKDNFGNPDSLILICSEISIEGFAQNNLDCDDTKAEVNPDSSETPCNLVDENCNGLIDEVVITNLEIQVLSQLDETCKGRSDGSIEISVESGMPPFTYEWSDGQDTPTAINLQAGVYTCTVTNGDGCQIISDPIVVGFSDILVYNVAEITNSSCQGGTDGAISINVAGGIPPYEIDWDNGDQGLHIEELTADNYVATITSSNGCILTTDEIVVLGNQVLTTGVAIKNNIDCHGDSTGFIQLGIVGGLPPYDIIWNQGDTSSFISNLKANEYHVTITDSNGCFNVMENITIEEPQNLTVNLNNIESITCRGDNTGLIDINVSGGSPPYSYFWSNGGFSQDLFNIPSGKYSVTITDFKACSTILEDVEIIEPDDFNIEVDSLTNVACSGSKDGFISIDVTGGTAPYIYNWSNSDGINSNTSSVDSLTPGQYFVTIVDAFGCKSLPGKFEVNNQNIPINISLLQLDDLKCYNDTTASIIAVSETQNLPIDFNWSAGSKKIKDIVSDTLIDLASGKYNITITDSEGCIGISDSINIESPSELSYEVLTIENNDCHLNENGIINISANGGTGTLSYLWNNNQASSEISNLPDGVYQVSITDQNNCIIESEQIQISSPDALLLNAEIENATSNDGGSIIVNVSGGAPPYEYNWQPPFNNFTDSILINLDTGNYDITIVDANGCSLDTTLYVDFSSSTNNISSTENIKFYPNPTYDIIRLKTNLDLENAHFKIYNSNGLMVKEASLEQRNALNLKDVPAGVYIIETVTKNKSLFSKVVVLH